MVIPLCSALSLSRPRPFLLQLFQLSGIFHRPPLNFPRPAMPGRAESLQLSSRLAPKKVLPPLPLGLGDNVLA